MKFKIWCATETIKNQVLEKMEKEGIKWRSGDDLTGLNSMSAPLGLYVNKYSLLNVNKYSLLKGNDRRIFDSATEYEEIAPEVYLSFPKADLKPTDIVKLRNGTIGIVLFNRISEERMGIFNTVGVLAYLEGYKDDLTHLNTPDYDIVAVLSQKPEDNPGQFLTLQYFFHTGKLHPASGWTWERKEPKVKELTKEEAAELLKAKFAEFDEVKIVM